MLELSYILLSVVILVLIYLGYAKLVKVAKDTKETKDFRVPKVLLPIGVWTVYIVALSLTKILHDYSFPPRFPLLVFVPFFILVAIFYSRNRNNRIFAELPLKWTTFYQTFRIPVEMILLYTFFRGIIPQEATFEGLNYDILMGITAIAVGFFLAGNIKKYRTILMMWNIVGILLVLFVGFIIGSSVYAPHIWGASSPTVSLEFISFPFLLIPGVLAPSAIFIHVVSIIQIRMQS